MSDSLSNTVAIEDGKQSVLNLIEQAAQKVEKSTLSYRHKNELKSELELLYKRYTNSPNPR